MRIAIAAVVLLMLAGAAFADVNNVALMPVNNSGVSGTATTISGNIAGPNPFSNVEVNARLNQSAPSNTVYQAWLVDTDNNMAQSLGVFQGNMLSMNTTMPSFSNGPWNQIQITQQPANSTSLAAGTVVAQGSLPGNSVAAGQFNTVAVLPADEMYQMQVVQQRYPSLTNDQVVALRMQGYSFNQIALMANAAAFCNKPVTQVASMVQQGQSWDQIASTCNTTVAQLYQPQPITAVAGYQGQVTPTTPYVAGTTTPMVPMYYLTRPNGGQVLTYSDWQRYHKAGYDWRSVAIAANISQRTGVSVGDILRQTTVQGLTFRQIAMNYNVPWGDVNDVSAWPWERNGESTMMVPSTPATPGTAGPMYPAPSNNQGVPTY